MRPMRLSCLQLLAISMGTRGSYIMRIRRQLIKSNQIKNIRKMKFIMLTAKDTTHMATLTTTSTRVEHNPSL